VRRRLVRLERAGVGRDADGFIATGEPRHAATALACEIGRYDQPALAEDLLDAALVGATE
jgi:hypothetical protein